MSAGSDPAAKPRARVSGDHSGLSPPTVNLSQLAPPREETVTTAAQVAMTHPSAVQSCNLDLEALISDTNRTIATLAITTLLKTGNESSVERLLKQIGSFMSDIADDFKIVVVEAIRTLCLKFPQKCAPRTPCALSLMPWCFETPGASLADPHPLHQAPAEICACHSMRWRFESLFAPSA